MKIDMKVTDPEIEITMPTKEETERGTSTEMIVGEEENTKPGTETIGTTATIVRDNPKILTTQKRPRREESAKKDSLGNPR